MLPFTVEQFFGVFAAYNAAIWPMQIVAYVAGTSALLLALRGGAAAGPIVAAVLTAMWLWTGIGYHMLQFAEINPAAYVFGVAFVLQGVLFAVEALQGLSVRGRRLLRFDAGIGGWCGGLGIFLIAYAGVLYPLLGSLMGHPWAETPSFGVTPCPLTIFTFGLLCLARPPVAWWLLVVPLLWSVIGGSAAFLLAVPQDLMLPAAGLAAAATQRALPPRPRTR